MPPSGLLIDLATTSQPVRSAPVRRPNLVLWAVGSCVLLGAAAAAQFVADRRLGEIGRRDEGPTFPLAELPRAFPGWRFLEGAEQTLDPQISRVAGSSDHMLRTYVDEKTGVAVTVVILYGRGPLMSTHVPEACYPNVGYRQVEPPIDRDVPTGPGSAPGRFRSLAYARDGASGEERQEVYYSFRHDGRWYPNAADDWKEFRFKPSVYKVQVQRTLSPRERRLLNNPTERFLAAFLPEFEHRLTGKPLALTTPEADAPAAPAATQAPAPSGTPEARP